MADKVSKASVDYGPGKPRGDHCGICRYYQRGGTCEKVEGAIDRMGWCRLFEDKFPRRKVA